MFDKKKKGFDTGKYSRYWFDEDFDFGGFQDKAKNGLLTTNELLKLASFRRSCANFVHILTQRQDITVKYADGDESFTDGKTVTLSSNVEGNFDSTVGLALHEASHICKTNFRLLRRLFERSEFRANYITDEMVDRIIKINPEIGKWDWQTLFDGGTVTIDFKKTETTLEQKASVVYLLLQFKSILNWIEDRRIDRWVKDTAVGYRGYYDALYLRYFLSDEVTKALKANKTHNTETMDSYMFRIINLMNTANKVNVLKGMPEIKKEISWETIDRLQTTEEVADLSKKVLQIILDNITDLDFTSQTQKQFKIGKASADGMGIDIDSLTDEQCKKMFGMGKKELKKLLEEIAKQNKFTNGTVDKEKLSAENATAMTNLQDSGVTMQDVEAEEFNGEKTNVLMIEKISENLINSGEFSEVFYYDKSSENEEAVNQGIIYGKLLGKKLLVRNEEHSLKYTRQDNGRIDRRLVASLGYDATNIFSKLEVNNYNKAHIHISIDASGSMNGERFMKALKTSVAIAVACKMTQSIECVIDFRTTHQSLPIVVVGYDSRRNQIVHIRKFFPHLRASGSTPESLCYELTMKRIFPKMGMGEQLYFVNFSDGEPAFSTSEGTSHISYGGEGAYAHCRRMTEMMQRQYGASIISYFISEYGGGVSESFQKMYGVANAFSINTDSMEEVARVMNNKFLTHKKAEVNEGSF